MVPSACDLLDAADAPTCSPPTDTAPYPNPPYPSCTSLPSVPFPVTPFPVRPSVNPRAMRPLAHPPADMLVKAREEVRERTKELKQRQRRPDWCDGLGWELSTHVIPAAWGRCTPLIPEPSLSSSPYSTATRRERVWETADELMQLKRSHVEGTLGKEDEDERVLWLVVNRYAPRRGDSRKGNAVKGITLLFAHAIGFPKEIWEPTIRRFLSSNDLHSRYPAVEEIWCIESVQNGDSAFLNQGNLGGLYDWQDNARDILTFLASYLPHSSCSLDLPLFLERVTDGLACDRSIQGFSDRSLVAVGHSFGGCTSALAARFRPSLFSAVVLVDPVIIPNGCYHERIMKEMVRGAVGRREGWRSREEAARLLYASPFFAAWDKEALDVYLECGLLEDCATGVVRLKMSGIQEAILFTDTRVPAETFELLSSLPPSVALHWVLPGRPAELGRREMAERVWRRREGGRVGNGSSVVRRASHLIVQECPAELAAVLGDFLEEKFGLREKKRRRVHALL
ncbi:hypothetical protein OE88DRAFT_1734064 [Heliocybe sulcata]|uniref:AB hydrolase-1 domain-containing protein n=1 Tax=Heliocybe sulcata TaxID=5364 RepID=A0A5C3N8H7_9AGAM|nr:hypothetical protein OE88DRAFT_1734064 [Heliocybe sulcata]